MQQPVLIVEDHQDARRILERYLEHGGYPTVTATNGREALEHIANGLRPSLILLDIMMPVMDGPTFAECLRALSDNSLASTPIVLLSGNFETESASIRCRAAQVICKPVSLQQVLDVVGRHCSKS